MQNRTSNQKQCWDKLAGRYNQRFNYHSACGQAKIERKAKMLIMGATILHSSGVLEIGCGTGIFTRELAKTNASIIAMDLSPKMIQLAIKFYFNNVCYDIGDAHKTFFKDGLFDAVVGCYILQYLDLSIALPEIKRVLRPGGRVAFIDINTLNPLAFAKTKLPLVKKVLNISREAVSFTPWGLRNWFARYGFTDIEVRPFEFGSRFNFLENIPIIRQFGGNLLITAKNNLS